MNMKETLKKAAILLINNIFDEDYENILYLKKECSCSVCRCKSPLSLCQRIFVIERVIEKLSDRSANLIKEYRSAHKRKIESKNPLAIHP